MKKRSVLLAIATLFIAGTLSVPAQAHPSSFADVSEANPAHNAIEYLVANSILSGLDSADFGPSAPVDRAKAVKTLVTWRGEALSTSGSHFTDVTSADQLYVETALARGWLEGYPDGTFHPNDALTREQMAILIVRSLGLSSQAAALPGTQIDATLRPFVDGVAATPAARPFLALAVQKGLLSGDGPRLNPRDPVTRAQFSMVVFRAAGLLDPTLAAATTSVAEATRTDLAGAGSAGTDSTGADAAVPAPIDPQRQASARFMDQVLFQPHSSAITGEMVLQNTDWYGVPVLPQLVIMAAETSLGDPILGGALARRNNFGCLRYAGTNSVWGQLSDGVVRVAGKDWYSFPTPQAGMVAFGRYLKSGVNGFYMSILDSPNPDWRRFAAVYYGSGVSGFSGYVSRLYAIQARFRAQAAASGVSL